MTSLELGSAPVVGPSVVHLPVPSRPATSPNTCVQCMMSAPGRFIDGNGMLVRCWVPSDCRQDPAGETWRREDGRQEGIDGAAGRPLFSHRPRESRS